VIKRLLRYWNRSRPDIADECHEKFNPEFIRWVWDYPKRTRPKVIERLKENSQDKKIILLRSQAEVEKFLASLL
jgi:adenylate kinase family enzyme